MFIFLFYSKTSPLTHLFVIYLQNSLGSVEGYSRCIGWQIIWFWWFCGFVPEKFIHNRLLTKLQNVSNRVIEINVLLPFQNCILFVSTNLFVGPIKSKELSEPKRQSFTKSEGNFTLYLQWRHNEHDGVSNHRPHDCLLSHLFRCRSTKTPKLRVTGLCAGNSPVTSEFPAQGPVTRKMFPFGDVIMIIRRQPVNSPHVFMISRYRDYSSRETRAYPSQTDNNNMAADGRLTTAPRHFSNTRSRPMVSNIEFRVYLLRVGTEMTIVTWGVGGNWHLTGDHSWVGYQIHDATRQLYLINIVQLKCHKHHVFGSKFSPRHATWFTEV